MTSMWITIASTTALCFAGMLSLSLAMDRHYEQVSGKRTQPLTQRWIFRVTGTALLVASLWFCITGWGATVGFVAWWGFLTAGAIPVVAMLPYWPWLTIWIAVTASAGVALGALLH